MEARRATIEDVPQLSPLWALEHLSPDDLEKRFTEFQVVTDKAGRVLGTAGIQIVENHGLLHGEAVAQPEFADEARALLWKRIQMVAKNHCLDRIWTRLNAPFWRTIGFRAATDEEVERMPEGFGEGVGVYLLPLREGDASAESIEKQFAMLRALNEQESEKLQHRVSVIKKFAIGLTIIVSLLVVAFAVVALKYGPKFLQRSGG